MRKICILAHFFSMCMLWYAGSLAVVIKYNLSASTLIYSLKFVLGFAICSLVGYRTFVSPEVYEQRIEQLIASSNRRPIYKPLAGPLGASVVIGALAEGIYFRSLYAVLGGGLAAGLVAIAAGIFGNFVSMGRPHLFISRTVCLVVSGAAATVVCVAKTLVMKPNRLEPLIKPVLAIAGGHYGLIGSLVAGSMLVGAMFAFQNKSA